MSDDETWKERVGRWYHHRTLRRTYVGLVAKLAIEWTMLASIVTAVGVIVATLSPVLTLEIALSGESVLPWILTVTTAWTYGAWCYGTVEPED